MEKMLTSFQVCILYTVKHHLLVTLLIVGHLVIMAPVCFPDMMHIHFLI